MIDVIRETIQVARKQYDDDGYEWLREYIDDRCYHESPKPTFADYRVLVWIKKNPHDAR